jgi:hypothetical protein
MPTFTFQRTDTRQEVTFKAKGKGYARANAAVRLGLNADNMHLLQPISKTGKAPRSGAKPRNLERRRSPQPSPSSRPWPPRNDPFFWD